MIQCEGKIYTKYGNVYTSQNDEGNLCEYQWNNWADIAFDRKGRPYIVATMHKNFMEPREEKEKIFEDEYGKMWGTVEYLESKSIAIEKIVNGDVIIATDGSN